MQYLLEEQWHGKDPHQFKLMVPLANDVQQKYRHAQTAGENPFFPYWARLWPAAIALADLIAEQPALVENKNILELAAGLGLPSLQASFFARHIICSDREADAVEVMQQSVDVNGFKNIEVRRIDWNAIPNDIHPDLVLLSDINYEEAVFEQLYTMLMNYRRQGVAIWLSTPQRLIAKPFIERLLPHGKQHLVRTALGEDISILLL